LKHEDEEGEEGEEERVSEGRIGEEKEKVPIWKVPRQ
jgi:hypothetical protein